MLAHSSPPAAVKVMSFNIRYGTAADGVNHWDRRQELVAEAIQLFNPDLLGVQEALSFQCEFLRQRFPDYEFFGRGREADPAEGEFCAVMFRRDRFHKTDGGHFWLSKAPDQPGSRDWDATLPRMVTWVSLQDRRTGKPLVFANTHYDHEGDEARQHSSRIIRQRFARYAGIPIVLTGDFNAAVGSAPYRILLDADPRSERSWTDSFRVVHGQPAADDGTFGGWTGQREGARIDWIVHSGEVRTLNAAINYHQDGGRYPSDHYPVQAVLRIGQ
jgi:endonuclease/exonuclease/phosphatase family metal-dependent hydrolase